MKNRTIFLIVVIGIFAGLVFELSLMNFINPEDANLSLIGIIPDCSNGTCEGVVSIHLLIASIIVAYSLFISVAKSGNWKKGLPLYLVNFLIGAGLGYLIP